MRLLMIDNYDSFTYNLVQYLGELGASVKVHRNDVADSATLLGCDPEGVVVSPGPGEPRDAGISVAMVQECVARGLPLLGVCLGHQAIGVAFGGRITRARSIMHGKLSAIEHDGAGVFAGVASPFEATRYHSLVIDEATLPEKLRVTARTADGEVMGVRNAEGSIEGVQFHPESIMTGAGKQLLGNFLDRCRRSRAA